MAEVRARAPGKIILSGEHAVVHGSTAVAAVIDLCTHVIFRLPSSSPGNDDGFIELELKDMGLQYSWQSSRLKEKVGSIGDGVCPLPSSPFHCSRERTECIASLVQEQNIPEAIAWLSSGLSAFLHLYTSIQGFKAAKVVVSSDLPLSSGLGSSAAFCVSLSAALLALSGAVSVENRKNEWLKFKASDLELVNKWAFEGEKIIHGKPSGIDNTVSTFGSMIKFQLGELTPLKSSAPLKMLVTNTKVGRNTKALVAGVSERALSHPDAMASVFTAVDYLSKEMSTIIESPAADDISLTVKEDRIQELMEMNQGLLQCMGVSHASIEAVLQTTLKYKLTSKLTGAGGGGCVLTLLPTSLSSTVVDKVVTELESCGFQCSKAEVGRDGLQLSYSQLFKKMQTVSNFGFS